MQTSIGKHVHKYYHVETPIGKLWACAHSTCNHHMPDHMKELVKGKYTLCWNCNKLMTLDPIALKMDKPFCENCRQTDFEETNQMHPFIPSIGSNTCSKCHKSEISHTSLATCECCSYVGPCEIKYGNLLMCPSCIEKEAIASKANYTPEKQQERVDAVRQSLDEVHKIDQSMQVREDIFNAETVSIIERKKLIDSDDSVPPEQKHFALASEVTDLHNHLKQLIFDTSSELVKLNSRQIAVQSYLNDVANKLRVDQRESLRLKDINYSPTPVKVTKPKSTSVGTKKFDKTEVNRVAKTSGMPESMIQMVCVQKGWTPQQFLDSLVQATKSKSE